MCHKSGKSGSLHQNLHFTISGGVGGVPKDPSGPNRVKAIRHCQLDRKILLVKIVLMHVRLVVLLPLQLFVSLSAIELQNVTK